MGCSLDMFLWMMRKCSLVIMNSRLIDRGICMIVLVFRSEDVYDGCWARFYVSECGEISLYVDLY